jgi:hypothetical protein
MPYSYYLQTETEQETLSALKSVDLITSDNSPIKCDISFIGPIFFADGSSDLRFHTNLLTQVPLTEEQKSLLPLIYPTNPVQIWM